MTELQIQNIKELNEYINYLEGRIVALENSNKFLNEKLQDIDTSNLGVVRQNNPFPKTGLLSNSFLKRCFTVWGYCFVAQLIISLPFICIYLLLLFSIFRNVTH